MFGLFLYQCYILSQVLLNNFNFHVYWEQIVFHVSEKNFLEIFFKVIY
jgi:hypothetical protein